MIDLYRPIPKLDFPQKSELINPVDEKLVRIENSDDFVSDLCYINRGIDGAVSECFVRETVYNMLQKAVRQLPQGFKIKIFDAWRPVSVQKALYNDFYKIIKSSSPSLTESELIEQTSYFVSYPSEDVLHPFVHSTGGAVDMTIVDASGIELDMGTDFDDFTPLSHTAYFENSDCHGEIRQNRRLLYNAMTSIGFTNLPSEWWHYDFGTSFWATINHTAAKYAGILK